MCKCANVWEECGRVTNRAQGIYLIEEDFNGKQRHACKPGSDGTTEYVMQLVWLTHPVV